MDSWYKPSQHGWKRYKGRVGYYKGRGRGTISVKPRKNINFYIAKNKFRQNTGGKIFWFKFADYLASDTFGRVSNAPGITPVSVTLANDFAKIAQNFLQYKVLMFSCRWVPNKLGTDGAINITGQQTDPGYGRPLFERGETVIWADLDANNAYPTNVSDIISKTSTKIINPMHTHRKLLYRPKGYYSYGELSDTGGITLQDEWQSSIRLFGEGYSLQQLPLNQRFWTQIVFWKVLFRGRRGE